MLGVEGGVISNNSKNMKGGKINIFYDKDLMSLLMYNASEFFQSVQSKLSKQLATTNYQNQN